LPRIVCQIISSIVSTSGELAKKVSTAASGHPGPAVFVTTHWSVVLSARERDSPQSAEALEKLCRAYWYPLYAYARSQGRSAHDAEDATQEFFTRLLQKSYLDAVERERGRFRTFLLVAFKRFLADEHDRAMTQKRGGGQVALSLDTGLAEQLYQNEGPARMPADRLFEKRWALTLLEQTMKRLKAEFVGAGKADDFERLKPFLAVSKAEIPYATMAARHGINEGAIRIAVHRLRKRFREIFRQETAQTVAKAEDVDEELRHLMAALAD
jgi:RNA polymerase sigma-70 factor (ECF subfamily)